MSNELCWYEGADTTARVGPTWPLDGTWTSRCHCGWEDVWEFSEDEYNAAVARLEEHRGPNPNGE